jgi:transposase-like protein
MRYPASEKLEIIRTVEGSHLPTKQTLDMLGIPRSTFYRWYDLYLEDGLDGLSDKSPSPKSVWNRIPDDRRDDLIEFALEHEALTSRELAVKYTDEKRYYVSESSVYRILKETDLITAPDYVVIKAAEEFKDKTTAINQMWQTDFTYFKIIGWGWYYLSTILDDYSRYIIAWKLCSTMRASDVTETIELALAASGCDQAVIRLSFNTSHACSVTTDHVTSRVNWLNGCKSRRWSTFVVRLSIRKRKARSNAGTRP